MALIFHWIFLVCKNEGIIPQTFMHIIYMALCEQLQNDVRSEVFTAVTMMNGVFWDVTPCGSCKNRRFGGT
jgi:hypothetical protein